MFHISGDFKVTCIFGKKGDAWANGVHQGIDLVGISNKKVYSISNGIIERAGFDNSGFGNYVRIKEDGSENRIYLAHLSKIYVNVGQRVSYDTVVGLMGKTGNATNLYVLEEGVANVDGYIWDKVRIKVNSKEGYMINKNYK